MDLMDPMDFLHQQKNKIVHLVYQVHLVYKMPVPEIVEQYFC